MKVFSQLLRKARVRGFFIPNIKVGWVGGGGLAGARRKNVFLTYLLSRGQSIKVFSQLLRKARTRGFLTPNIKV